MPDKFTISALAQTELEESAEWYEEQLDGLGERFSETVYISINTIIKAPVAFPKKNAKIREFVLDDFPFIIVYEYKEKENAIYILHIFHTSRNPKLKYKRK